jgi:hypothetical protein
MKGCWTGKHTEKHLLSWMASLVLWVFLVVRYQFCDSANLAIAYQPDRQPFDRKLVALRVYIYRFEVGVFR